MNDGGPAFPHYKVYPVPVGTPEQIERRDGMSLRDWYAGMAMQAFVSRTDGNWLEVYGCAYKVADAMIAERDKNRKDDDDA